ncbi:S8 family serine peptidase [Myxococcota bacterium]|nr:S8 family serine peptidase [Myxococcota bacterium]
MADPQGAVVTVEGKDVAGIAARVRGSGGRVQVAVSGQVQAWLPWAALFEVAAAPGVTRVRPPLLARPAGDVTGEGVEVVGADSWVRNGHDGDGTQVAVVDLGFAGWEDLAGEEVPGDAPLRFEGPAADTEPHGTAVAELIYDLAPGADYVRYAFSTDSDFIAVVQDLLDHPVDVVNASIGFPNYYPSDGDSGLARAVDAATDAGMVWVAAAGNEAQKYRIGPFGDDDGDGRLEWEQGGAERLKVYAVEGGLVQVVVRWDDPYGDVRNDFDIQLATVGGDVLAESAEDNIDLGYPFEDLSVEIGDATAYLTILAADAPGTGDIELSAWSYGGLSEWTAGGRVTVPADARGAVAVGAWDLASGDVASFSSLGPTEDGRDKPEICAPSGVSTRVYGDEGFPGTSAAAPHVTGMVALALGALGGELAHADVPEWLAGEAVDVGAGVQECGAGLAHLAGAPPPAACGGCHAGGRSALAGSTAAPALALAGVLAGRRRRRT